jgi:hypothetical protein
MRRTPRRVIGSAGRAVRALSLSAAVSLGAAAAAGAAVDGFPQTEAELRDMVVSAMQARDFAAFERLINWDQAGTIKRRIVGHQVRHGFGRPIAGVELEAFPADGLAEAEATGRLKANMPVSHLLRVTFDEPPLEATGRPPTAVFLVGRSDGVYRIALVNIIRQDDD